MNTLRLAVAAVALALVAACSNPETDFKAAQAENTEAAYRTVIDKHPDSEWARKAQAELDILKERRDWENAQTADVIEAYNNYLLAHPVGMHIGSARQRIYELETEAAWNAAQAAGTRVAVEDFLIRYADAPQAEQARSFLASLAPPPPPATPERKPAAPAPSVARASSTSPKAAAVPKGDYRVQLGAFSSRSKAENEKSRMQKRYESTVGQLAVRQPAGDSLYRVQSAGMSENAARSACQKLKGSGQDCMVVRR